MNAKVAAELVKIAKELVSEDKLMRDIEMQVRDIHKRLDEALRYVKKRYRDYPPLSKEEASRRVHWMKSKDR